MSMKEQLDKGIAAHGMWKARLRTAIDTGKSDFTVEKVKVDNGCDFGKWLYALGPTEKGSPNFAKVKDMHAQFHTEAARILALALAGNKAEAEKGIAMGSKFADLSSKVTGAMMEWKRTAAD